MELEVKNKNGKMVPIEASTRVIKRNGKIVGTMNILRDISERKKAEEEIKTKSQFLESLIEQSPLPTFVIDSEGIVVMVNKAFLKAYNVPKKEMVLGKNALTEPANVRQGVVKYIKEALSGKIVETPEIEFISPYENKKTVTKSRLFPIFDTANRLINVVVMHEDITERKKMAEKERQYFSDLAFLSKTAMELVEFTSEKDIYCYVGEQIRQLFPQSIVIINSFNKTTDLFRVRALLGVGKLTTRFLKILRREPVGMTFPINDQARKGLSKGELAKVPGGLYELAVNQIPQSVCNVLEKLLGIGDVYAISFIWKGELCGSAAILMRKGREPKNPKLIETFVRQASVTLQRLQTEDKIKEQNERLKELDRMKSEFLSTAAHELRTPLTSILGFSEILVKKKLDEKKQTRFLEIINKEAGDLADIINNLLDVSSIESGRGFKITKVPTDIRGIILENIDLFKHQIDKHTFKVNLPDDLVKIEADKDKINQVIENLISNAVKFSPEGGEIRVSVEETNDGVKIIVTDKGMGISKKDLPHVFERFYRGENASSEAIGGTGLGLAIAKYIIESHKGKIWAESKPGKGSTFSFTLPTKSTEEKEEK